jgi:CRISPR-associated protein Cst1
MPTITSATNSTQKTNVIDLYPSNWLYNAGVVGFLISLEMIEKNKNIQDFFEFNKLKLDLSLFGTLEIEKRYFSENKISSIVGNSNLYRNYLQPNQKKFYLEFVKSLSSLVDADCNLCNNGKNLENNTVSDLNLKDPGRSKFLERIKAFNIIHSTELAPSFNEFPNASWACKNSISICHLCSFIIIHHHLALTRLSDGSEIFINAPSFEAMWHLNKFAREILQSQSKEETRGKREILAMTIIEYATKIQTTLGQWTSMNIEIVSKKGSEIQFFSLPYQVVQIISDRKIASLLSDIGEFKVLNIVLNQEYKKLLDLGYKTMRWGLTKNNDPGGKSKVSEVINKTYFLQKNRDNPLLTAQKLLELYVHIEQKLKNK